MSETQQKNLPAWDLTDEYPSLESAEYNRDFDRVKELLSNALTVAEQLEQSISGGSTPSETTLKGLIPDAQKLVHLLHEVSLTGGSLYVYASCELSVDGSHSLARRLISELQLTFSKFEQMGVLLNQFTLLLSDALLEEYLSDELISHTRFSVEYTRALLKDNRLPVREEKLLAALAVDGPTAWGNLYNNIASTATCTITKDGKQETIGFAAAGGLLRNEDAEVRRSAFDAINNAWTVHQEAASGSINALTGWRLEIARRRSHTRPYHYLEEPLFSNRTTRETLDTLISVARERKSVGQRALRAAARALGVPALRPSDLLAPCPAALRGDGAPLTSYQDAITLIKRAFGSVSPEMGDFVDMMAQRNWIEARQLPKKRPGAYCTHFPRSRGLRVFMTFLGSSNDVKTLAHELGHAFHTWAMRELPVSQTYYPMTVAETASNFGEMILEDYLRQTATNESGLAAGLWQSAQDGCAYTINIPMRFSFECALYTERESRSLNPDDLRSLMRDHWKEWYGDTFSEEDAMFWASKLHFHIAELSFYNFPYLFGYLFSLGVYGQRERLGADFYPAYTGLLRDTGRMAVEDLAKRHLDVDLKKPDFWLQSFKIFEAKVVNFERAVNSALA